MPQGLPRKIRYAFVTQGLLSVLAVVFGVSVVTLLARNALIVQHLNVEAEAFWQRAARDPGPAYLPATRMVRGYFGPTDVDGETVPADVESLRDGVSQLYRSRRAVLVERRPEGTLYLVAETGSIDRLMARAAAALILSGLLAIFVITWWTYRRSRGIVLPVNHLARMVARWDPSQGDASTAPVFLDDPSQEVRALTTALRGLAGRVAEFVQRERDFTRDASHELRTPLTVIRVAADMMLGDPAMPPHGRRSLERIQRAGRDMEAVIDAFLILAREGGVAPLSEEFEVRDVVLDEMERARALLAGKPVELRLAEHAQPRLFAPPRVLGVVLGNLLHNACTFTEAGSVEVAIEDDAVVVRDTGIGMSAETLRHAFEPFFRADAFNPMGKGFGLSIASRLARRFGWQLSVDSAPAQGTTATLRFVPLHPA